MVYLLNNKKLLLMLIAVGVVLRFMTLGAYELYDATEARYAGIAFRMADREDFLTPWFLKDVPFLGKPPLSFWATALSFKIFNSYHEFFARLPHFFAMILVALWGYFVMKKERGEEMGLLLAAVFIGTPLFQILAGTVMTDAWMTMGIAITNFSFFFALKEKKGGYYGYLCILGLAISTLSKGLVGVGLSAVTCFLYVLIQNRWRDIFKLPILQGIFIKSALVLPWFLLMEKNHPGFLKYFIVGEHFQRFLVSGWEGDKYGYAHSEPPGMIWAFFALSTLPSCLYLICSKYKKVKDFSIKKIFQMEDFTLFCLISFLTPLLLLTFAKNIIIPYAAPAILPFSFLFTIIFTKENTLYIGKKMFVFVTLLAPVVMGSGFLFNEAFIKKHSDKIFIQEFEKIKGPGDKLYYLIKPEFSSYFYSRDEIIWTSSTNKNIKFFVDKADNQKIKPVFCYAEKCLYKKP